MVATVMVHAPARVCAAALTQIVQKTFESIQFWVTEKLNRQNRSIIKEVMVWYRRAIKY